MTTSNLPARTDGRHDSRVSIQQSRSECTPKATNQTALSHLSRSHTVYSRRMAASFPRRRRPSHAAQCGARRVLDVLILATSALGLSACDSSAGTAQSDLASTASTPVTPATRDASRSAGPSSGTPPGDGVRTSGTESSGSGSSGPATATGSGDVSAGVLVPVISVIDGDTIAVRIDGVKRTIRLIGVDTPETRKPNTPVQCFGPQASSRMQSLVQSRSVRLEADPSQGDLDKYGRSLRYVFTADGPNVAQTLIAGGFGREYTHHTPYRLQGQFRSAQTSAQASRSGLWGACPSFGAPLRVPSKKTADPRSSMAPQPSNRPAVPSKTSTSPQPQKPAGACVIKGNINSKGEKIYHLPGSATYARTKITASKGERYFCSEADAISAGWRPARD